MVDFFGRGQDECPDCWLDNRWEPICTMNCSNRSCENIGVVVGAEPVTKADVRSNNASSRTVSRTMLEVCSDLTKLKRYRQGNKWWTGNHVTVNVPVTLFAELDAIVNRHAHLLKNVGTEPPDDRAHHSPDSSQHE